MKAHDPACRSQDPRTWRAPEQRECDCRTQAQPREPEAEPEIPPIIATVKAGDQLTFLMPQLADHTLDQLHRVREILRSQHPGVSVQVVPAVGVVHIPAPKLTLISPSEADRLRAAHDLEELSKRLNVCAMSEWSPASQAFRICALAPNHQEHHRDEKGYTWPNQGGRDDQ